MRGNWVLNRVKNRIKDRIVRMLAVSDEPHSQPFRLVRGSLSGMSVQEKESLYLDLKKDLAGQSGTIAYSEKIFLMYSRWYQRHSSSLDGIRILEIGPGNNLGAGIYFLLAGAQQYVAVDALAAFPERPKEYYANLLEEIRMRPQLVGRQDISDNEAGDVLVVDGKLRWNEARIQYLTPVPAEQMPLPDNHFDYLYSHASFEHFEEPEKVIREIFRVLKPGGLTAHMIDLRDHVDFAKPREFLKVPPREYRFASPYNTNRWRSRDFEKAFREAGFRSCEIHVTERAKMEDAEFEEIDIHFRKNYSRSDLEILALAVVCVK